MKTRLLALTTSLLLLVTACADVGAQVPTKSTQAEKAKETKHEGAGTESKIKTSKVDKKSFVWPKSCPVTVLGKDAFTPASEGPDGPPKVYDAVWYGTPALYTMINPDGRSSLNRWLRGEKTFWWSENFAPEDRARMTVTAEHLDGSAQAAKSSGPAGGGSHPTLGDFMLVGVKLPEPGCWELTASYEGASLSYVIWVEPTG